MKKGKKKTKLKNRNIVALALALRTGGFSGCHKNRSRDILKGRSRKVKHKGVAEE